MFKFREKEEILKSLTQEDLPEENIELVDEVHDYLSNSATGTVVSRSMMLRNRRGSLKWISFFL